MLSIYTIYNSPSDYPGEFVIKKWDTGNGKMSVQDPRFLYTSTDLESCRAQMKERNLTLMARQVGDDPVIVESWI